MSNIKISELPEYTGNTSGSWLVMDNSTQTETFKVLRENIVSTTSGSSGTSGYNGTGGTSGTSGSNGTNGSSGTSGSNGTNGSSGTSGSNGTNGSSGSNGTDGTSGSNGTNGSSGSNGTNGSSGSSGSNGTNGSSGSNGTDGSSGTSGDSLFALTGSVWNTTNNVGITGSLNISGSVDLKLGNITAGKGGGFKQNNTVFGAGTLISNSVGDFNTAVGYVSLYSNTSGSRNVGLGFYTLANNTTGNENTAIGYQALASNITEDGSTAVGHNALLFNDGRYNVAIGADAMKFNTSGVHNVAVGTNANTLSTTGNSNTIIGFQSNYNNRIGGKNTTLGDNTMFYNVSGSNNVAIGLTALLYNQSGNANVVIGSNAGRNETGNENFYLYSSTAIPYSTINEERSGSLMWGTFSTSSVLQTLQINASTDIRNNLKVTGSAIITGSVQGNVNSLSISSNTASLNLNDGNFFTLQLVSGSATNLNPSNIIAGQTISIFVNTIGSATMTFPSSIKQISGSAYVPTTTTGIDILTLISKDSSSLFLVNAQNFV
jgi:hypothetical protein